ncbi:class I SAM-dependent methyltransferase [Sphingomonas sp. PR090111-T3T-6A]|uniref:class I SAM-dependent methyltransferase n=1 Tax=Sphingomonas sp. PR090111-T3T-6A TaxID=685778 RepID=UPI00037C5B27|nr:class I SAM-dependent methyltransferase [Sphingomonas sp. PR090111-T3T-6A]
MTSRPLLLAALLIPLTPAMAVPPGITAAITDPGRPAADKDRDTDRKPAQMLVFAQIKPGQSVIDYLPGKGYFTRLFSAAVGPKGSVYAAQPEVYLEKLSEAGKPKPPSIVGEAGRGNVHDAIANNGSLGAPEQVDLVWTSQNYHDVHIWGGAKATAALNKAAFEALKPGGVYVIEDHAGPAGLDDAGMSKLHRIDEALVKKEVLAAGFKLDGESPVLHNPADPHTANVFDPSIRGKTDQFVLRFRKPR